MVACASADNCSAAGYYSSRSRQGGGNDRGYVVNEVNGTWRHVIKIAGITLSPRGGGIVRPLSVSCAKAGECSVVGDYEPAPPPTPFHAFVASEVHGAWHAATAVPGMAALDHGGTADLGAVSCSSPGNCSAGGGYSTSSSIGQAFVVDEIHGIWHTAVKVPGITGLNHGRAAITEMSCVSPGNCSAGGDYQDTMGRTQVFAVNEVNGTWQDAIKVPGTVAVDQYSVGGVAAVSCAGPGNCSAGGTFRSPRDPLQKENAFVVNEVNGTWHTATAVPGLARLSHSGSAHFYGLSCGAVANCSAGGFYELANNPASEQAFLISEK